MELTITRLHDPVVDPIGTPVTSNYCEVFWLPVLGPTALWMLRHVAMHNDGHPYEVMADDLARSLGLGSSTGKYGPLMRTLHRLENFGTAKCLTHDETRWSLRYRLPPVPARQLARLPEALQVAHRVFETRAA